MKRPNSKVQADILASYLLGRPIKDPYIYDIYEELLKEARGDEERLVDFAFSHPVALPYLDAGLVFLRPESELRRRIYVMFSVLESSREYADLFLPQRITPVRLIGIFLVGIRAVFRAIIGIVLIKTGGL